MTETNDRKMAAAYAAHIRRHGPDSRPRFFVEEERELAIWAYEQGYENLSGYLPAGQSKDLSAIPGWVNSGRDRIWIERLSEYALWLSEHDGKHPRMNGVGTTAYERRLGVWATAQRTTLRSTDGDNLDNAHERVVLLLERAPGLLDNGWRSWEASLRRYLTWLDFHGGEHPRDRKGADPAEGKLARWLSLQRSDYKDERLDSGRLQALDRALPGWNDGVDVSWDTRLERYRRFVKTNNGCAPRGDTDNKLESFLFNWDQKQRDAIDAGSLDRERAPAKLTVPRQVFGRIASLSKWGMVGSAWSRWTSAGRFQAIVS